MADVKPVRLQLSRRKGFRLDAHSRAVNGLPAVNVARPRRWGNPWKIGSNLYDDAVDGGWRKVENAADAVQGFRQSVDWDPDAPYAPYQGSSLVCLGGYGPHHRNRKTIRAELRGKNLACWCKPGEPCHADVLLEIANR